MRNLLSATVGRLVPRRVIRHAKRVLFMGSLYFVMARQEKPDDRTLEEANQHLQLVPTKDGLKMSAALTGAIWKGRLTDQMVDELDTKLSQGCFGDVCKRIASITPKWLCYNVEDNSPTVPMEDIRKVISTVSEVRYAHR